MATLSKNAEYKLFLDEMTKELCTLVEDTFIGDVDPEVQWKLFRQQAAHWKRSQVLKWLEIDDSEND